MQAKSETGISQELKEKFKKDPVISFFNMTELLNTKNLKSIITRSSDLFSSLDPSNDILKSKNKEKLEFFNSLNDTNHLITIILDRTNSRSSKISEIYSNFIKGKTILQRIEYCLNKINSEQATYYDYLLQNAELDEPISYTKYLINHGETEPEKNFIFCHIPLIEALEIILLSICEIGKDSDTKLLNLQKHCINLIKESFMHMHKEIISNPINVAKASGNRSFNITSLLEQINDSTVNVKAVLIKKQDQELSKSEIQKITAENKELKEKIQTGYSKEINAETALLNQKINELTNQLQNAQNENTRLKEQLPNKIDPTIQKKLESLTQELSEKEKDNEKLKNENDSLNANLETHKQRITYLEGELEKHKTTEIEVENLRIVKVSLESRITELEGKLRQKPAQSYSEMVKSSFPIFNEKDYQQQIQKLKQELDVYKINSYRNDVKEAQNPNKVEQEQYRILEAKYNSLLRDNLLIPKQLIDNGQYASVKVAYTLHVENLRLFNIIKLLSSMINSNNLNLAFDHANNLTFTCKVYAQLKELFEAINNNDSTELHMKLLRNLVSLFEISTNQNVKPIPKNFNDKSNKFLGNIEQPENSLLQDLAIKALTESLENKEKMLQDLSSTLASSQQNLLMMQGNLCNATITLQNLTSNFNGFYSHRKEHSPKEAKQPGLNLY